jgi:hypothetical protein
MHCEYTGMVKGLTPFKYISCAVVSEAVEGNQSFLWVQVLCPRPWGVRGVSERLHNSLPLPPRTEREAAPRDSWLSQAPPFRYSGTEELWGNPCMCLLYFVAMLPTYPNALIIHVRKPKMWALNEILYTSSIESALLHIILSEPFYVEQKGQYNDHQNYKLYWCSDQLNLSQGGKVAWLACFLSRHWSAET